MYKLSQYNIYLPLNEEHIIYNTFSSSMVIVSKDEYQILLHNISLLEEKNKIELIKQKIIVPKELDEYSKLVELTKEVQYRDGKKMSLVIAPTLNCNYKCFYCFENPATKTMTEQTINDIAEFIDIQLTKYKPKVLQVVWFGGEPMLAYEKILNLSKKIISICDNKNIKYFSSMITNGSLFTEEKAITLIKKANLNKVQITLDGLEKTYCERKRATVLNYRNTINNIINLTEYLSVSVRLNVDKENFQEMNKLVDEILENVANKKNISFYLAKLVNYSFDEQINFFDNDNFALLKETFDKKYKDKNFQYSIPLKRLGYCGMNRKTSYTIGPDGELYKCEHCLGDKEKVVGYVKSGLFYTPYYNEFMDMKLPSICSECSLFPLCAGGCKNDRMLSGKVKCNFESNNLDSVKRKIMNLYLSKVK